jgi:hypothetical protein
MDKLGIQSIESGVGVDLNMVRFAFNIFDFVETASS